MPKQRKGKKENEDVSKNDTSLDEPSTSSQPIQRRSSRRKASPFRGFDEAIDQNNLTVMKSVAQSKRDEDHLPDEELEGMSKRQKGKKENEDVSKNDTSLDEPSTSSQPTLRRSSCRKDSPFRGFDEAIDQKDLKVMKSVVQSKRDEDHLPDEELEGVVTKKRKQVCPPKNSESKKVKVTKDPKKGHSNDIKKKPQKGDFPSKFRSRPPKHDILKDLTHRSTSNNNSNTSFLGAESKFGNIVNTFDSLQRGVFKYSTFDEVAEQVTLKELRRFIVFARNEDSDRRITAIAWHPTNPRVLVSGGKAGTLVLYEVNENKSTFNVEADKVFPGCILQFVGPGGTMENIRFNPKSCDTQVFTASVDGSIASYHFENFIRKSLIESPDSHRVWFCGLDIHQDGKSVYGGDSEGNIAIHHLDNGKTEYNLNTFKLHRGKIRHLEFNPRDPNLLVTCSLDKTVKLWDIRNLKGKTSCIECLVHDSGISAAKFSRTDGCRLLTTDIQCQLRVYKAPFWTLEHKITHPHRHFQHLTVIRASWHPRADLFVVGRYPDPKLTSFDRLRSVDVFSASSGKLCNEFGSTCNLITSLTEFNCNGRLMASTTGRTLNLWKPEIPFSWKKQKKISLTT
ncbi:DNA damage-binding protein 2-like [Macrosteles quadrilineatus]|uniref:DNA damage-binding protein 2-like n=1 Tax=Macrosteles quadrilineatus TaxID=74068 RepID=UPI0023E30602|nr:DNA damage-binding protein 2-like [Macrosteles quadrilineatus]